MNPLSRRGFFKATGAALATSDGVRAFLADPGVSPSESEQDWKLVNTEEYTNICCYCAGGCGIICCRCATASWSTWKAIPIIPSTKAACARRALPCSSCATWLTPRRAKSSRTRSVRRARWCAVPAQATGRTSPGMTPSTEIARIGQGHARCNVLSRRTTNGVTVNYTPAIASLGGSQENSEEEYLILKMPCAPWASSPSTIRLVFDTAPLLPVWQLHSVVAP